VWKIIGRWFKGGKRTKPADLDGACPICDHPFGDRAHACLGGGGIAIPRRDTTSPDRPQFAVPAVVRHTLVC